MKQANPNAGSLIGIGVVGLLGYFGYKALTANSTPAAGTVTTPAVVTPDGSVTLPQVTAPASPAGGWSMGEREALMKRAASGDLQAAAQVQALGWTQSADQWNYWRAAGGGGQTTQDLFPADNRQFAMTINDYLNRRKTAGLGGLGYGFWG